MRSAYPLTALECELLDAVARDREDEAALSVLADYWLQQGDETHGAYVQLQVGELASRLDLADEEARLSEYAMQWRRPALEAGYAERDLAFDRGVLQWPLAVAAGSALDEHPDVMRISPRYYREVRAVSRGRDIDVHEAEVMTPLAARSADAARVAIKSVSPAWEGRQPFPVLEREAAVLAQLHHRNVSRLVGWTVRPDGLALVVEWAGVDLQHILSQTRRHQRTLGLAFAISVALQLCDALAAIHAAGIVHKEIRPDHLVIAADGTVTVIDFGYVKSSVPIWPEARYGYPPGGVSPAGGRMHGLRYMSPQQVLGRALEPPTDVFSAALTVYELADGQHRIQGTTNDMDTLIALRDCRFAPSGVPRPFASILERAVARQSSARPTPVELRNTLAAAAEASRLEVGPHVIAQTLVELGIRA
jgi:hypothetical protein